MIAIPNMEKPKSCGECKFFCGLGYGFHCYLNGKHITFIGEVEDFCPLIEIDDELFKKAESAYVLQQIRERRADERTTE